VLKVINKMKKTIPIPFSAATKTLKVDKVSTTAVRVIGLSADA